MSFTVKEKLNNIATQTGSYPKYTHGNYLNSLIHECTPNCNCCRTIQNELQELQNTLKQTLGKFNQAILHNNYDYSLAEQLRFLTVIIGKMKTMPDFSRNHISVVSQTRLHN